MIGFLSLGAIDDLWEGSWSGWAFPAGRRTALSLLENSVGSSGNEVIQEASLGYRRGRLSFTAQSRADRDTVRGYDEASTQVTFTDEDGSTCTVLVDRFGSEWVAGDLWAVEVELVQLTEPVPLGS